jgi:hypothetical protein
VGCQLTVPWLWGVGWAYRCRIGQGVRRSPRLGCEKWDETVAVLSQIRRRGGTRGSVRPARPTADTTAGSPLIGSPVFTRHGTQAPAATSPGGAGSRLFVGQVVRDGHVVHGSLPHGDLLLDTDNPHPGAPSDHPLDDPALPSSGPPPSHASRHPWAMRTAVPASPRSGIRSPTGYRLPAIRKFRPAPGRDGRWR